MPKATRTDTTSPPGGVVSITQIPPPGPAPDRRSLLRLGGLAALVGPMSAGVTRRADKPASGADAAIAASCARIVAAERAAGDLIGGCRSIEDEEVAEVAAARHLDAVDAEIERLLSMSPTSFADLATVAGTALAMAGPGEADDAMAGPATRIAWHAVKALAGRA